MHIPDGFLSTPVIVATYTASTGFLAFVMRRIRQQFDPQTVPKLSLVAAFIFVAQMINIPVSPGTSGHLIGGVLAAVLTGPFTAMFIMALVLFVQMLLFQDGGLTALGANILNIGIAGTGGGYFVLRMLNARFRRWKYSRYFLVILIFFSAWLSVEIGALLAALELGLSGVAPLGMMLKLMLSVHFLIGLLEAILTIFIYQSILKIRPDLVDFPGSHE